MKDILTTILGLIILSIGILFGLNVGFATHLFYAVIFRLLSETPAIAATWCAFLTLGLPPLFIIFMVVREFKKENYEKTFIATLLLLGLIGAFAGVFYITIGALIIGEILEFINFLLSLGSAANPFCSLFLNGCIPKYYFFLAFSVT